MSDAAEARLRDRLGAIGPLDAPAMAATRTHLDRLTKPLGSLGRLEALCVQLAGITGRPDAPVARRAVVVAAADHGVARQGVSAYPPEVTAQMVANFLAGGAAIDVLAAMVGASLTVVDVGVAGAADPAGDGVVASDRTPGVRLVRARIRDGTGDMTTGPAMTRAEALEAIEVGLRVVDDLRADGLDLLGVGEMGIGNTTAAAAVTAVLTGADVAAVTGPGTGIDAAVRERKIAAIELALDVNAPDRDDPVGVLAAVGGLEIAALVGCVVGAAAARIPVVLDGFIAGAAALVAASLEPAIVPRLVAGHRSPEPGHARILEELGLDPLLDLGLRLGEGTGAALAMPLIAAAARLRDDMATFAAAGVSERVPPA